MPMEEVADPVNMGSLVVLNFVLAVTKMGEKLA